MSVVVHASRPLCCTGACTATPHISHLLALSAVEDEEQQQRRAEEEAAALLRQAKGKAKVTEEPQEEEEEEDDDDEEVCALPLGTDPCCTCPHLSLQPTCSIS